MLRRLFLAIAALCLATSAFAQSAFDTPQTSTGGPRVGGSVDLCMNASNQAVPCGTGGTSQTATPASQYPASSTPIDAAATGTTAATAATLAGAAGKTTYICGYSIDADATAATVTTATISGLISANITRRQGVGVSSTNTVSTYQNFNPCIPASAANTSIVVTSGAAGSGGNTAVSAWGYRQ